MPCPHEKTLPLAQGARILLAGNEAKLADLKITDDGPFVMVRLTLDQKSVQAVTVNQR
jgi:hypothetical protein